MNIFQRITTKTLSRHKSRTAVIVAGVVVSVAMITGVLVFAASFQNYIAKITINYSGEWYSKIEHPDFGDLQRAKKDAKVLEIGSYRELCCLKPQELSDREIPWITVVAFDEGLKKMIPIKLTEGRMAKKPWEIVLPEGLYIDEGYEANIGDVVTVPFGEIIEGQFQEQGTKTYEIVGISKKIGMEGYSSSDYVGLSVSKEDISGKEQTRVNIGEKEGHCLGCHCLEEIKNTDKSTENLVAFFKTKEPKKISKFMEEYFSGGKVEYNEELISALGGREGAEENLVVGAFYGILICLIIVGAVALMYNALAISLSGRRRELGMLASIGATRKQLRESIYYEGFLHGLIGMPIGIACGIGIIGIALYLMGDFFVGSSSDLIAIKPDLHIRTKDIALAVGISVVTIGASTIMPAITTAKMPIIDALKQRSRDKRDRLDSGIGNFLPKILGFEGFFAGKSYGRNRRKYRATTISLVLSISLFVSASFVGSYFVNVESLLGWEETGADIEYVKIAETETASHKNTARQEYEKLSKAQGVTDKKYVEIISVENKGNKGSSQIVILEEKAYEKYLQKMDKNSTEIPVIRLVEEKKLGFRPETSHIEIMGKEPYTLVAKGETGLNPGISSYPGTQTMIMGRDTALNIFGEDYSSLITSVGGYFKSKQPEKTFRDMEKICGKEGISRGNLMNMAGVKKQIENTIFILNILTYGFVVFISLIAIANVFNTISASIMLRKGEFALLKAVGMDQKRLKKIMLYESVLYGGRALTIGLGISLVASIFLFMLLKVANGGNSVGYNFPWRGMGISALSVFFIIYATMAYAMRKVEPKTLTEVLKKETL